MQADFTTQQNELPSRLREGPGEGLLDKGYSRPTARSRQLRENATGPERLLWSRLRARQVEGTRFNRQFPIGTFVCDFVARTPRLIIEVDGETHAHSQARDAARTAFLESQGYSVIRFSNHEVMTNLDGVIAMIAAVLRNKPSPGPSRGREGSLWGPTIRSRPC